MYVDATCTARYIFIRCIFLTYPENWAIEFLLHVCIIFFFQNLHFRGLVPCKLCFNFIHVLHASFVSELINMRLIIQFKYQILWYFNFHKKDIRKKKSYHGYHYTVKKKKKQKEKKKDSSFRPLLDTWIVSFSLLFV